MTTSSIATTLIQSAKAVCSPANTALATESARLRYGGEQMPVISELTLSFGRGLSD